jgi:hypothetical protein
VTIGVAFLSAWMLAAPRCWFCALACKTMVPSKSAAAVKVIVTFRTSSPLKNVESSAFSVFLSSNSWGDRLVVSAVG